MSMTSSNSSVQFSRSVVSDSVTPWTAASQVTLCITNSRSLLKLMSIEWVMPSNHLILYRPLLLPPSIFPSIRVFSKESVLRITWPKVLEFQLQHQSFQWILRTDFLWDGLVGSPCSPRDSQESSPTPQFKSINQQPQSLTCLHRTSPPNKLIAHLAFLGSLLPLSWTLLYFWHFLLLNPLTQTARTPGRSTLLMPPPSSPSKILPQLIVHERIHPCVYSQVSCTEVQIHFLSDPWLALQIHAFFVFRAFFPWGILGKGWNDCPLNEWPFIHMISQLYWKMPHSLDLVYYFLYCIKCSEQQKLRPK